MSHPFLGANVKHHESHLSNGLFILLPGRSIQVGVCDDVDPLSNLLQFLPYQILGVFLELLALALDGV